MCFSSFFNLKEFVYYQNQFESDIKYILIYVVASCGSKIRQLTLQLIV